MAVSAAAQSVYQDVAPCAAGGAGQYAIYAPSVAASSYAQSTAPAGTVMITPASATAASLVTLANRSAGDNAGFVPAGLGGAGYGDRPLTYALDDAKAAAIAAMTADTMAFRPVRNTVVVLITSGKDSGDSTYRAATM